MTTHSAVSTESEKKLRILDAAELVFSKNGFSGSKVSEIAKEAGVADGTIYNYFKNKDDILISLFESRVNRVVVKLQGAIEPKDLPSEKLKAFLQTHFDLVLAEPNAAEVMSVELRQSSKFMKEYSAASFGDLLKLLAGIIATGQQTGEFVDTVPPPIVARMIFGLIDELTLAWVLGGQKKSDIVGAADWAYSLITQGLFVRTPSTRRPT